MLKGCGEARAGGQSVPFAAPCTLILPAEELHALANTGSETMEYIAVVTIGSKIYDAEGREMPLPWRE